MRAILLIVLVLITFDGFSQIKKDTSSDVIYYIDSERVNSISAISPDNISGLMIVRVIDSINKIKGKLYISSKKYPYHFITIEELTKRAIPTLDGNPQPVIYFVDDKLVTDTTGMKFEIPRIWDIEVINGSQIKAFTGLLSHVIIVKIKPGNATVQIRGNATPALFKQ